MTEIVSIGDYETLAEGQLPRDAFDYVMGGSSDEITLRENVDAFGRRRLRPRMLVDVSRIDTSTTFLGAPVALPVGFAPTAMQGWLHVDGEVASARATSASGGLFCASTMSSRSLEEIAEAGDSGWFQLYAHRDWTVSEDLVKRAAAAGYAAVVLTVDLPVLGNRERDLRARPHMSHLHRYGNFPSADQEQLGDLVDAHDRSLTWEFLDWLAGVSDLPLVVKGILTAEDATTAADRGAAGVVVSNHGGRQLDRVPATIDVLEEIVEAVGKRLEVYLDGGVRRATDIITAVALGARGVFIGRPLLYALAVEGEAGVR
ncbi:MAG: alpha-hydroxy-acid oxidizing protein, partial [Actinobacteria bacterium]|nr:alpha-hydroxy-acid oxidizing protein [Actinomycetota bacterium]